MQDGGSGNQCHTSEPCALGPLNPAGLECSKPVAALHVGRHVMVCFVSRTTCLRVFHPRRELGSIVVDEHDEEFKATAKEESEEEEDMSEGESLKPYALKNALKPKNLK